MRRAELGLVAALLLTSPAVAVAADAGVDAGAAAEGGATAPSEPEGHAAHAHGRSAGGAEGAFEPPEDITEDTDRPGTIAVHIRDPDDKPLPGVMVNLGIINNSIAKGEKRDHRVATTGPDGSTSFDNLEKGSQIAFRVSVSHQGGTFAAAPFQMPEGKGSRVVLHVYPVERDIDRTMVVVQEIVFVELRDDRVQLQQLFNVFNFGKTAWVPGDNLIPLPPDYTAFVAQQGMSDQGADAVPGQGLRLRGTFPPGQHAVELKWQVPYAGDNQVTIDVGVAPHLAAARVMSAAASTMSMSVEGFPPPQPNTDNRGNRMLITERALRREEPPPARIRVELRDIPTQGPARYVATGIAGLGVLVGLSYAFAARGARRGSSGRGADKEDRKAERQRLLAELAEMEAAHSAGRVGPKTYENARRTLIDAIARTLT